MGYPFHRFWRFSTIITGEDIINEKPHPEPYLKTAEKLGVAPTNALVIEDSLNGVHSGKAAGCRVIAITTSFSRERLMELQAERTRVIMLFVGPLMRLIALSIAF